MEEGSFKGHKSILMIKDIYEAAHDLSLAPNNPSQQQLLVRF